MTSPAEAIVRPTLSKGDPVTIASSPHSSDGSDASVVSAEGLVVSLKGRRITATVGETVIVSFSDAAALYHSEAVVEEAAANRLTVRLSEDVARVQRRDFARIYVELPIVYLVARSTGRAAVQRGTTIDVSAGGAAIRTAGDIAAGTPLPFVLRCDDELEIVGVARVIDSTEDRRGRFRQRLRFEQLRIVDRDELAGWVFRKQVKPR
ncbi:MAG: PilZ domain-containing protein [Actinomycetota bacterium]